MERAFCWTVTALLRPWFRCRRAHFPRNVNAWPPPCKVLWLFHRYLTAPIAVPISSAASRNAVGRLVPFCFIGILLGSLRSFSGFVERTPLRSRRPGLRSGPPVRSWRFRRKTFLTIGLPYARSALRPGERGVGWTAAPVWRFHAASPGWHPAPGFGHGGDIMSPLAQGSLRAGGVVPKIVTTSCRRFAPTVHNQEAHGRHPAKRVAGIPARQSEKSTSAGGLVKRPFHSGQMLD